MPHSWIPPPEIDQFHLERRLGRGATADVWLARDTVLDRVVALKIASTPASAEIRTRFRVEARAVAKMQHPNLIAIHHVGEVGERPFLVTEYLSGKSLDELDCPERRTTPHVTVTRCNLTTLSSDGTPSRIGNP
jgi:serine/threonine protein kinase